jgi:prepilin-type N-terminal cleavage/methylation domain-containing protein
MALFMLDRHVISKMRVDHHLKRAWPPFQVRLAYHPAFLAKWFSEKFGLGAARTLSANKARTVQGFTLVEVVMAVAILALVFSGIITAYIQANRRAEWTGYSLAAQALGIHQIEQARSAVWDFSLGKNEITNLNLLSWSYNTTTKVGAGYATNVLDLPVSGTNVVVATNFVTVKMLNLSGLSNVQVQMVIVDTVWPFLTGGQKRLYTNRTASYFGPDNRDASSL